MVRLFTSESVTEGHPDKICDQISDAILDAMLAEDPRSRVAVETMVTTGLVHVAGEVTTNSYVPIAQLVRDTIVRVGYDSSLKGFDGHTCGVSISIGTQSSDIAQGVDSAHEHRAEGGTDALDSQGAGDQGLMFGYACDDTAELMPLPIFVAHRLSERLTAVRKDGTLPYLRPDGKTQVTISYEGERAVALDTVVLSTQHAEDISLDGMLAPDIDEHVIRPVLEELAAAGNPLDTSSYRKLINPTGQFIIGGPMGDAGLTGRKIIVDTYGGMARHGGGAFSGKDPPRSTDPRRMPCGGLPRTSSRPASRRVARCRSPMRSARPSRSGSTWRRSVPKPCRWRTSSGQSRRSSTCGPPRSSPNWICYARSTSRRPPTVTSAARVPRVCRTLSPGSAPTASRRCRRPSVRRQLVVSQVARITDQMMPTTEVTRPVALVAVDIGLAHLDRPFEYAVPAELDLVAQPGVRVKVRFAGKDVSGFVLDRTAQAEHLGKLTAIRKVVSPEPVLTPPLARLCRAVADRYAGTFSDVVRLAVPARHAGAEKALDARAAEAGQAGEAQATQPAGEGPTAWDRYPAGPAFLRRLAAGEGPAASWLAAPTTDPQQDWPAAFAAAARATLQGGRSAVLIVPDHRDVDRVDAALTELLGAGRHVRLTADQGPQARYTAYLKLLRGHVRCVVGTRAAAFAPVVDLGLVAWWDDGDDLLTDLRAPYPQVREVLRLRAEQTGAALLSGDSPGRSSCSSGLPMARWSPSRR